MTAFDAALAQPQEFVLKPQREGGGNNVYGEDIPRTLARLSADERHSYVLMERLRPPERNALGLREGRPWWDVVVSEIGHFGVFFAQIERQIDRVDPIGSRAIVLAVHGLRGGGRRGG